MIIRIWLILWNEFSPAPCRNMYWLTGTFWYLGDTIAIFGGLASVGDFLMAAAMLVIIVSLMKTK